MNTGGKLEARLRPFPCPYWAKCLLGSTRFTMKDECILPENQLQLYGLMEGKSEHLKIPAQTQSSM